MSVDSVKQIKKLSADLTPAEIHDVFNFLKQRLSVVKAQIACDVRLEIKSGDEVTWNHKNGVKATGKVTKINRTTANVERTDISEHRMWRVPLHMLERK